MLHLCLHPCLCSINRFPEPLVWQRYPDSSVHLRSTGRNSWRSGTGGDPPSLDGLFHGKSCANGWFRDLAISGNLHIISIPMSMMVLSGYILTWAHCSCFYVFFQIVFAKIKNIFPRDFHDISVINDLCIHTYRWYTVVWL